MTRPYRWGMEQGSSFFPDDGLTARQRRRDAELRAAGFTVTREGGVWDVQGVVTAENARVLSRAQVQELYPVPDGEYDPLDDVDVTLPVEVGRPPEEEYRDLRGPRQ